MTFLVPFDGSELSKAALERALEYGEALGEAVVAVSVIPTDDWGYARERGWVGPDESVEVAAVAADLERMVHGLDGDVAFRYETVESSMPTAIAREIGRVADEVRPSAVFVGSENAGQVVTPLSSVGSEVAADAEYDVHVVRHRSPTVAQELRTNPELASGGESS